MGHTGAGKSTIAKLLTRFYDPREGRITIDGHDLREVTQESLRRQLGIVPQEGFLFAGTIAANIAFAHPQATRAEIEAAAEAVGADRFVKELPSGYDTDVGERGSSSHSGSGSWSRSRARPRRSAHPHPRRGDVVRRHRHRAAHRARLQRLLAGRTAFVIAHRLSTIRGADLIVVLDHGRIVEQGTHDELVDARGPHASLYGDWAEEVAPRCRPRSPRDRSKLTQWHRNRRWRTPPSSSSRMSCPRRG